jgi:hypothetical protein
MKEFDTKLILGVNVLKLFVAVIYEFSFKLKVFAPSIPLNPCMMIVGKARSLP